MAKTLAYTYDIYIGAPIDSVWNGLVDGDMTKKYVYGTRFDGRLKKGAAYGYIGDGDFKVVDGEILDVEPGKRLVMTWKAHWDDSVAKDPPSRVSSRKPDRRLNFGSYTMSSKRKRRPIRARSKAGR